MVLRALLITGLGLSSLACGGRTVLGGPPDASRPPDGPSSVDQRGRPDGPGSDAHVTNPDQWGPDQSDPDAHIGPCSQVIGTPCSVPSDCCGSLKCVTLDTGVKMCTMTCTPDDTSTPLVNEDSCPSSNKHVCGDSSPPSNSHHCLVKCKPMHKTKTCPAGIACHPMSVRHSQKVTIAVCTYPACASSKDCPVLLSQTCNMTNPGTLCKGSPPGTFCALDPGSANLGHCALPGPCNKTSGLCMPHSVGKQTAKVGDPCKDDLGCAGTMRCEQETLGAAGLAHARNGYCTIEGCSFGDTLFALACPAGATCNNLTPGGRCFKTCDLGKAADCRGNSNDTYGDYDCYAWNNLATGGVMVAKQPTCEPADTYACTLFGASGSLGCSALGTKGNPTQMACRNRSTGAKLPKHDPSGFCLDTTASGK